MGFRTVRIDPEFLAMLCREGLAFTNDDGERIMVVEGVPSDAALTLVSLMDGDGFGAELPAASALSIRLTFGSDQWPESDPADIEYVEVTHQVEWTTPGAA